MLSCDCTCSVAHCHSVMLCVIVELPDYTLLFHTNEPWHVILINVVCVTSKVSDLPAPTHSLIRASASLLNI